MGTINLPGIGPVPKGPAIAAVGGTLVVGFLWWRHRQNLAASAAEVPAVDTSAVADTGSGYGYQQGTNDTYGGAAGSQGYYTGGQSYVSTPSTNAEWALAAMNNVTNVGFDPIMASVAIGKYLGRKSLIPAEADLIRTAIAMTGLPPIGTYQIIEGTAPPVTTTDPPATGGGTTVIGGSYLGPGVHVIPGAFNQAVSARYVASFTVKPELRSNPNAVEAALRKLVMANPSWRGKTTVLGGHKFIVPP